MERQIEITSSFKLFNPERYFYIVGALNKAGLGVRLELYPVVHRLPSLHKVPYLRNRKFVQDHRIAFEGDGRISADQIHSWWKEYGDGSEPPIERIHLPFHYNIPSALKNYFWNSLIPFAKPYEPGTRGDRAIASAVAYMTMTAANLFATKLAGQVNAGLNAHVNMVEQAGRRGTLLKIKGDSRYIDVENDLDYPREDPLQFEAQRNPERAFRVVERYGLHGAIYGADHAFRAGEDSTELFEKHRAGFDKHLRVIHLSGSRGDHGLITEDDHTFWRFIDYLKDKISDDVSLCLDIDPFDVNKLTEAEQVDHFMNLIRRLKKY